MSDSDRAPSGAPAARVPNAASLERQAARVAKTRGGALLQAEKLSMLYPVASGLFARTKFVTAVDGVSLYLRRGETLGLVGESGSGKTTLGRCLIRLVEPTLGRVVFDGIDVTRLSGRDLRALRRRMQIVFQDPYGSLNPRMTVREIVGEGITIFELAKNKADLEAQVARMLQRVGLSPDMMSRFPHEFSGGQRQRIGIARALAVGPELVICDEPVSALDVSVQAQILNLLESIQEELNVGLLFISHDLSVVEYTSHRIAVMYAGRIVETGATRDVGEKRLHPYTQALWSATPKVGDDGKKRLVLAGEPPSAIDPPRGCAFHPRCPRSEVGKCDVEQPPLDEIVPGSHHRVACWHPHVG